MAKRAQPTQPRVLKRTKASPANPVEGKKKANGEGSNAADLETFHFHVGEIRRAQAAILAVRKTLKQKRRDASDAGINLGDLDLVMRMSEEEPETVQGTVKRIATYAHWMGLAPGVQADLFEAADDREDLQKAAENEGYREGIEGLSPTGDRYDPANPVGQARMRGWNKGQDVLKERFLNKQKPADPTPTGPESATVQ